MYDETDDDLQPRWLTDSMRWWEYALVILGILIALLCVVYLPLFS